MSNKYGLFWNSNNGDRTYDADSFAEWLKPFFKNGVFVSSFSIIAGGGMTVSIGAGTAYINGKLRTFDTDTLLTIPTANGSYPRIDNIVVERNDTDREITLKVVQGTYSGTTASASGPTRANGIYQLVIARVSVGAGITEITASNITDCRADTDLCGYVSNAIESPDFGEWYQLNQAQFEEWYTEQQKTFKNWFSNLQTQLSGDVAGNLQNQITAQNTELENNKKVLDKLTYPWNDQAIMGSDSYVCDVGQIFAATLNSNTSLTLADGEGVLQGVRFRIPYGSTVALTIASGTSGYKRIDLVVARYTKSTGAISFVVIKGTRATSSPATPAYTTGNVIEGATVVDFPLYKITIDGTTVSSVDKLFTQLQTMAELQTAVNKLNTDLSSKIIFRTITITHSGTTNGATDNKILDSISGYSPAFVAGVHEQTNVKVYFYSFYIQGKNHVEVGWRTVDGSTVKDNAVSVTVAYIKN